MRLSSSNNNLCSAKNAFVSSSEDDDDDDEDGDEEDEEDERMIEWNPLNMPADYWQIQKLMKYLKNGNQTSTLIALCSLLDFDLTNEKNQMAIKEDGGVEMIVNLLETEDPKCRIGALKILKELCYKNQTLRKKLSDYGAIKMLVKLLFDPDWLTRSLAAETLARVATFQRAKRAVRKEGGISKLVATKPFNQSSSSLNVNQTTSSTNQIIAEAKSASLALWTLSSGSRKNRKLMWDEKIMTSLVEWMKWYEKDELLVGLVGVLKECTRESYFRKCMKDEGLLEHVIFHLIHTKNSQLQMLCASTIEKCAVDDESRDLIRAYGGLTPLVEIVADEGSFQKSLVAATGAIWKCSPNQINTVRFQELKTVDVLVNLLMVKSQPDEVVVNVAGALSELARDSQCRSTLRKNNGIPMLISLLTGTNHHILTNAAVAVGRCAEDSDCMNIIDKLDGVRLLWSLLKNSNINVQVAATWALCPCVRNVKDPGEIVRSFVGGLELLVEHLTSNCVPLLQAISACISEIATDQESLAVMTDHGVVSRLSRLLATNDLELRHRLAEAIARCCNWNVNRLLFNNENAVRPLVHYLNLTATIKNIRRSTTSALYELSKVPENCVDMHGAGVVKPLVDLVGSDDIETQEAAASCLLNIRRLALANERARMKK
ncbi:hypothetical protein HELRODRAFT_84530 [Helobdella robusta]|uniref:Armadillo repeat-containing protein 4 n=1 Tax=Helobdella robusta TaxID=6412 RepID=T1G5J8_HELRO|nr:hypothetical protein HELRODRAFT_84530 [Helobdella robusta]ESN98390.1 hypothetical protein HELRODRAFT_84530 [Helobdella robusta]